MKCIVFDELSSYACTSTDGKQFLLLPYAHPSEIPTIDVDLSEYKRLVEENKRLAEENRFNRWYIAKQDLMWDALSAWEQWRKQNDCN